MIAIPGFDVFYIIAGIIIGGSIWMVMEDDLFRSCMALALTMIGIGILYFSLEAEFIAVVHLLIYAGAVTMLYLFIIMLTRHPEKRKSFLSDVLYRTSKSKFALFFALLLLFIMVMMISKSTEILFNMPVSAALTTADIGKSILTDYIVPFELVSVLLTLTLIGAIVIARGDK